MWLTAKEICPHKFSEEDKCPNKACQMKLTVISLLDVITSNPIHPPSDANMVMVRTLIEHKEVMLASKSSIDPPRLWRDMT